MSRKFFRSPSGELESSPSFKVDDDSWLKMKQSTLIKIILGVAAGITAWLTLKSDVADNTKVISQLVAHQAIVDQGMNEQRTTLLLMNQVVTKIDEKVDYLTGARRSRPPATPPTPATALNP